VYRRTLTRRLTGPPAGGRHHHHGEQPEAACNPAAGDAAARGIAAAPCPGAGYTVTLRTRRAAFSAVAAELSFQLLGSASATNMLNLNPHAHGVFASGAIATLRHPGLPCVGDVRAVRLRACTTACTACAPGTWSLDEVEVECLTSGSVYTFEAHAMELRERPTEQLLEHPAVRMQRGSRKAAAKGVGRVAKTVPAGGCCCR
jgi:hypothetical protein